MNLKTVRAYNIKLSLELFWEIDSKEIVESYLKRRYFWATHSKLDPIIAMAKTLKRHWPGIMNYFTCPISNGILDALNRLIQSMKTVAGEYWSMRNFLDIIYLRFGKLDFALPKGTARR